MPTAEELFRDVMLPLYPPDAAADLAGARAADANPANNPSILEQLDDAAKVFVKMHARTFGRNLDLDFSDASVHRLGAALTRDVRDALHATGTGADNELFNVIVHGCAYVGACVVRGHAGSWQVRRPLWESLVHLRSHAGEGDLWLLGWWLRSLADDAYAETGEPRMGLAERYRAYVEVPCTQPDDLPRLAAPRALPRLRKPQYHSFHKYLRAHVPELRDLGADFPSAERFDAYDFSWLDFLLVGDGRMLVISGAGAGGLHVFWLGTHGFLKSALFAAEAMPEPLARQQGDKLAFVVSYGGQARIHETLWWGP